jgi:hypothetical protein
MNFRYNSSSFDFNRDHVLGFVVKARSPIKTGAPEVFEGMNERFVPLRYSEDLVDLRANESSRMGRSGRKGISLPKRKMT